MAGSWTDSETFKLVEIWSEEEIQALLEGCTRNKHVYDKIAREMVEAGYERTGVQCREKLKKLKTEYKRLEKVTARRENEGKHGSSTTALMKCLATNQLLDQL